MRYVLGVDGGGTKTTALVSTMEGTLLGKGMSGPSNYQVVGLDKALETIVGAINAAVDLAGIGEERFATACFGLSGVGRPIDHQIMRPALEGLGLADRIILDHDAAMALAGAFACQPGVIVIAGTGSTAYGINDSGENQRASGWGHILGDEGSGYYIGHKALISACRAYDGRGEKTVLVEKLIDHLGLTYLIDLVRRVYVDGMTRQEIAALVPVVLDAARNGDSVAAGILDDAGTELGISAATVIRKLGLTGKRVRVATDGGIFQAGDLILSPFKATIKKSVPLAEIVEPRFKTIIGAVLMALKESGVELTEELLEHVGKSVPPEKNAAIAEDKGMVTEKQNIKSQDIDKKPTEEILRIINSEDEKVAPAIERVIPEIAAAVELIVDSLSNGGRLFYIGAGTSGRLGVIDAAECPPTFGTDPELVQGVIAGGDGAVFRAQEGAEDNWENGGKDLLARGFKPPDVVVGLSTSGKTPYVKGALEKAGSIGCGTIAIACNPNSEIFDYADVSIAPIVGPEVLTGSTRMKAGTAEKLVLNMLSSTVMIKLGKVTGNLMTSLRPGSNKLVERSRGIVMSLAGVDYNTAADVLKKSKGKVNIAIVMIKSDANYEQACKLLDEADGNLEKALERSVDR